jgi:OOP family OmpA-OmpF porin
MLKDSLSCSALLRSPLWLLITFLLASAPRAQAHELEVGGFLGGHFYLDNNELGRPDGDLRSPGSAHQHTGIAGLGLGYGPHPNVMFEGELGVVPGTTRDRSATYVALNYRGHLLIHILKGRIRPFLLVGGGAASSIYSTNEGVIAKDTDAFLHGGLGLKINLTQRLMLRIDGRILFPPNIDNNLFTYDFEALLGLYGRFDLKRKPKVTPPPPPRDSDGDGINDDRDRCPSKAEDADQFEDDDGCPDPDNDKDGVLDGDDKCPAEAGIADNAGCPDKDGDGDGIVDRLDQCPAEAGVAEHKGCPEPDTDKDGILDKDDKCPQQAGVKALGGCPDQDNDGIADAADKCPDKAENKNGFEDDDGCPDEIPQAMARFTGVIQGINFKTGKDVITKKSFKLLDQAVAVLKQYPSIHLEISGHTDNVGDAAKNKDLSQRRADAVKRYFISKGLGADRLIAKGYGPEQPIADNKTKAGKTKNRRVEFKILSQW